MAFFIYYLYIYRGSSSSSSLEKFIYSVYQYIFMTKRLCVSIPDDLAVYLEVNTDLNPSRILQEEIKRIKDIKETFKQERETLQLKIQVREEAIEKLNNEIMRLNKLLDENGII